MGENLTGWNYCRWR